MNSDKIYTHIWNVYKLLPEFIYKIILTYPVIHSNVNNTGTIIKYPGCLAMNLPRWKKVLFNVLSTQDMPQAICK